ncbi:glycoside hydrolase [Crossiella sp. SN42]|uniref:sialidase family protein n=1 Tax=Crossiella sp. SN42 TaxID=2944808 RepID=UPI00207CB7AB|nr:sialidase family protein [Crossiella sp. SN42]MCO1577592.1 glycoside hydrolase [Crossiella sp. SN42]
MTGVLWRRVLGVVLAPVLLTGLLAQPATAAAGIVGDIVREPGAYEARFPDLLKLRDNRLLAVWHRATAHEEVLGTIRMSIGTANGRSWSEPVSALWPGTLGTVDTRDPKLALMPDGRVMLTFFVAGRGQVYYSMWTPGEAHFSPPKLIEVPDVEVGLLSHGSPLVLANRGSQVNQVLLPVYTVSESSAGHKAGAHFIRATYLPGVNPALQVASMHQMIANGNPAGRWYGEPSFVQYGDQVVAVVRAEQARPGVEARDPSPAIVVRWNPYTATPQYSYQSFSDVLASSHHLLKTASGKLLFTYGDRSRTGRPTVGMMISNPTANWTKGKVVPIYNSGVYDQANPSSVEIANGTFLTLGYNAKPKTGVGGDPTYGGTLWVVESHATDY